MKVPKIRRVAEKLSRNRVILRHVLVAGKREPLYVTPDAQLKYLKFGATAFDHELVELAEKYIRPGWCVWDVGANVGTFFVAAASKVGSDGSVLAVEADPWLASLLWRTARHPSHRGKSMRVLCAAASNEIGIAEFSIVSRGRASNSLSAVGGRDQMGGIRYNMPVPTIPLAQLLSVSAPPNMIKIDVEGAEELVLEGLEPILRSDKPLVYCEVGIEQFDTIYKFMGGLGYDCRSPSGDPTKVNDCGNYLFVPI